MPGQQAGGGCGQDRKCSEGQVIVGRHGQILAACPTRGDVQGDTGQEERDRKVDEHDVLGVLGEDRGTDIPGIQFDSFSVWNGHSCRSLLTCQGSAKNRSTPTATDKSVRPTHILIARRSSRSSWDEWNRSTRTFPAS